MEVDGLDFTLAEKLRSAEVDMIAEDKIYYPKDTHKCKKCMFME